MNFKTHRDIRTFRANEMVYKVMDLKNGTETFRSSGRRGSPRCSSMVIRRLAQLQAGRGLQKRTLCVLAWLAMFYNHCSLADEKPDIRFTASGTVNTLYYSDGEVTRRLTNNFTCQVAPGKYAMVLTVSNPNDERTRFLECLYDGTNTFFTRRFDTNPITSTVSMDENGQLIKQDLAKPIVPNNNAILEISSGSMPPSEDAAITLVWAGLGSLADLSPVIAEAQEPLTFLGPAYEAQGVKLKAAARTHDKSPGFLEQREDYHGGFYFSRKNESYERVAYEGALSQGYTNSIFSVVSWTNVGAMEFPKEMTLTFFLPATPHGAPEYRILSAASINSIELACPEAAFHLEVGAKTTVAEKRHIGSGPNRTRYYLSQDGTILDLTQVGNDMPYKVSANQPVILKQQMADRRFFLAIFIGLFLGPVIYLIWRAKTETKTK